MPCGTINFQAELFVKISLGVPAVFELFKGEVFANNNIWIAWVERNFRNPTVKLWENLDNPFKRTNYAKFWTPSSLDGTLPESSMRQDNNSPLTLYIYLKKNYWILIVRLIKFNHKCMHKHLGPRQLRIKLGGTYTFWWKVKCCSIRVQFH